MRFRLMEYYNDNSLEDYIDEKDLLDYTVSRLSNEYIFDLWQEFALPKIPEKEIEELLQDYEVSSVDELPLEDCRDWMESDLENVYDFADEVDAAKDDYISEYHDDLEDAKDFSNDPWKQTGMSEKDFI